MKPRCHILYTALALICMSSTVFAQTARLYDSGSGLPSTQINDVFQDSAGLLWVATNTGLYRFEGMDFMGFHHESDKENSLSSDLVAKVFQDSRGVFWVGTSTGLQIFDTEYNTFAVQSSAAGGTRYFAQQANPIQVGMDVNIHF